MKKYGKIENIFNKIFIQISIQQNSVRAKPNKFWNNRQICIVDGRALKLIASQNDYDKLLFYGIFVEMLHFKIVQLVFFFYKSGLIRRSSGFEFILDNFGIISKSNFVCRKGLVRVLSHENAMSEKVFHACTAYNAQCDN